MPLNGLTFILIFDVILMILGILFPISNYNGVINGVLSTLIFLFLFRNGKFWFFILASFLFFLVISTARLYCILDVFTVTNVLGLVYLFGRKSLSKIELCNVKRIYLIFYLLNLSLTLFPSRYEVFDGTLRFMGIFFACNLSVSVMTVCGVAIWEIEKKISIDPRRMFLIINIIGFIILAIATRTRTVLFLLPYWMYECYSMFNRKMFIGFIVLGCGLFASSIIQSLNERMNLEGDASSATRASIYIALIDEILKNHIVIPHGSNEAFFYIKKITGDSGFSSHNDFLRYIYDWGLYFFVFVVYLVSKMKKYVRFNFEFYLILLGYSALGLHNMLFLPIAWIPFCIVLNTRKRRTYIDVKSYKAL